MIKIENIARDFLKKHGSEVAATVTGATRAEAEAWEDGRAKQPKPAQLSAMLEYDPDPIHSVAPLYPKEDLLGNRLAILMPTNRDIKWQTMQSINKLFDSAKMQLHIQPTNFLIRGRNQLAWKFLQSKCEWSLWVDDDMVLPCGDAGWFKDASAAPTFPDAYAGLNAINALLRSGQKFVGGCYFHRQPGGKAQFNEAYTLAETNAVAHHGPRNDVIATRWVGTGCLLVHRSVYVDIAQKGLADRVSADVEAQQQYRYGFFDPISSGIGEDVSFCDRASKAGHQPHVDFAVMPAHIGQSSYNYFNTRINY